MVQEALEKHQLHNMNSMIKGWLIVFIIGACGLLYLNWKMSNIQLIERSNSRISSMKEKATTNVSTPTMESRIMFVETTDNMEPTPLAVCAVESAAHQNPDKQIYYFMKGFSGNLSQYPLPEYRGIHLLSSLENVVILPLNAMELFEGTPLKSWYLKVNPEKEKYWIRVFSDACRLALIWKYGGTYLDTDIISLRPLPIANFLCPESRRSVSNGALGLLSLHHPFMWNCMLDFVANYIGDIWGQQGPRLITRMVKKWCRIENLGIFSGKECNGISLWTTNRFYPIPHPNWMRYNAPWKKEDIERTFSDTYGAHVWNSKNSGKRKAIIVGSGSLIEHFSKSYCSIAYKNLIQY
ncbi:alpha-1,4-N-acetylglucosaminyltransferase-like isoform X1 [Narcine bancroftii]|uniref:alpha-1,4-N-acetylglucosaminyltransferase-like isoform X1 n=2 Tax=Narcine bancroftii TaxID=1343680 RepID=UPI0038319922